MENAISSGFCFCILLSAVLRVLGSEMEAGAIAIAGVLGWAYLLFFLLAVRLTGPFVVRFCCLALLDCLPVRNDRS